MTIKDAILAKFEVKDGVLTPKRTKEQSDKAFKEKTILEQEYKAGKIGEYQTIQITDLNTSATATTTTETEGGESIDLNSIRHTDIIRINGIEHNVVALKSTTEVLETITDGIYQCLSIFAEFSKTDAECVEGNIKPFKAQPIRIPKERRALNVRNGFIIVEPGINGFKISILAEELDDQSYNELIKVAEAIDKMHAYFLCKTVKGLAENGVPVEELIRAQAAVGLVPKARNSYARRLAEESSTDGKIVYTQEIKDKSARFADKLNEDLGLMPLTTSSFKFGIQVYTIEVSTDPKKKATWTSSRNNLSYFNKGTTQGRVERLVGNRRTIPLMAEDVKEAVKGCEDMINAILPIFENAVRNQLGVEPLKERYRLPDYKPEALSIVDLFSYDPVKARKIATDMATKANKAVIAETKSDKSKSVTTLLGNILSHMQNNNTAVDDDNSDNSAS